MKKLCVGELGSMQDGGDPVCRDLSLVLLAYRSAVQNSTSCRAAQLMPHIWQSDGVLWGIGKDGWGGIQAPSAFYWEMGGPPQRQIGPIQHWCTPTIVPWTLSTFPEKQASPPYSRIVYSTSKDSAVLFLYCYKFCDLRQYVNVYGMGMCWCGRENVLRERKRELFVSLWLFFWHRCSQQ